MDQGLLYHSYYNTCKQVVVYWLCLSTGNSLGLLGSSPGHGIFIFSFIIFVLFQMDQA